MINLKDFISSVLVDIDEGIKQAKEKTGKDHVLDTDISFGKGDKGVQFDVAITASSEVEGKADAKIKVISGHFFRGKRRVEDFK